MAQIAPVLLAGLILIVAGCAGEVPDPALSADHPANPQAATLPLPRASTTEPATQPATAARYVCPMHPEVVAISPGKCPKCGMQLVRQPAEGKP